MKVALCFAGHMRDLSETKSFWTDLIKKYNIMLNYNPLEQFEVYSTYQSVLTTILSLTNIAIFLSISLIILISKIKQLILT